MSSTGSSPAPAVSNACRMASYSATDSITASGVLWLVTTTLPTRPTARMTPRQPCFLTAEAGLCGKLLISSSLTDCDIVSLLKRFRLFYPIWEFWPLSVLLDHASHVIPPLLLIHLVR